MYETDPEAKRVIDVAKGLEGLRRQDGIHAAAVVITDEPADRVRARSSASRTSGNPDDAPIVTQYEMHGVEDLGLLKMDFLGLRNLSVIERALDLIEVVHRRAAPTSTTSPSTTSRRFEMLRKGDSMGVFQLEGGPMRVAHALARPHHLRRRRRPGRPLPAGPDGGQHAPGLRRPEERPPAASPTPTPTSRRSWPTPTA